MNTYRYSFGADCPNNGDLIIYRLEISSAKMIHVEHIKIACALHNEGYQESIAADLHARFGGTLRLVANHHGVEIETLLVGPEAEDEAATPGATHGN